MLRQDLLSAGRTSYRSPRARLVSTRLLLGIRREHHSKLQRPCCPYSRHERQRLVDASSGHCAPLGHRRYLVLRAGGMASGLKEGEVTSAGEQGVEADGGTAVTRSAAKRGSLTQGWADDVGVECGR